MQMIAKARCEFFRQTNVPPGERGADGNTVAMHRGYCIKFGGSQIIPVAVFCVP